MVIVIEGAGTVSVREPNDFGRFHVDASGASMSEIEFASLVAASIGRMDTHDQVSVDPNKLQSLIGPDVESEEWEAGFDRMVAYARTRGWVDKDGLIAAHVEHQVASKCAGH